MKTLLTTLLLTGFLCGPALAQRGPLHDYDWTQWLDGEWEGISEGPNGTVPIQQSFTYILDGRYLYTELQVGEGAEAFRGVGIFQYVPEADSAFGNFFDMNGVTNDGWGKRFGDRMVWHIDQRRRGGRTTTRIRERISADEYVVRNYVVNPDGTQYQSTERLRRKAPDASD